MMYVYVGSLLSVEKPGVFSRESLRNAVEVVPSLLAKMIIVEETLSLQNAFYFLVLVSQLWSLRIVLVLQEFSFSAKEIALLVCLQ